VLFEGFIADQQGLEVELFVAGRVCTVDLVGCKAGRTVTPSVAAPMLRLATAPTAGRKHTVATTLSLVHQSPRAGTPTTAVAPGVGTLPRQRDRGEW